MDTFADISRRLESLIRVGTIAEIDHGTALVRVKTGGLTTAWLPWLSPRAGSTREWNPPSVGEQCILLAQSGDPSTGIVLVGLYSSANPAPSSSPSEHIVTYPDGATIKYDHAAGALSATGIKTAMIQASTKCTVDCPSSEFSGDVVIKGNLSTDGQTLAKGLLTYQSGMAGSGGASGKTVISGAIEQSGSFHHSGGEFTSDSILKDGHKHIDSMGGQTGDPIK